MPSLGTPTRPTPGSNPTSTAIWALIFTSGTSDAPKAVICSQRRLLVTGKRMSMIMDLGPDDIGYVCMPLFHSNAVQVGWAPSLVVPCAVGLGRRFSASRWLARRAPLSRDILQLHGQAARVPARPTRACRRRRQSAARRVRQRGFAATWSRSFGRRFGLEVIDAYGATEGGVAVNRDVEMPRRRARPRTRSRASRRRRRQREGACRPRRSTAACCNAEECVGEIVNTQGVGPFEGYYNNHEATAATTRNGWYWSGDLGYKDEQGFLYFAGRNADWIRVDGENFPAGPIEEALRQAPGVVLAAVYGVPDDQAGDQVMAGLVWPTSTSFDPDRVRALARRPGARSARSGGRATCASCAIRRPRGRTRS